jgi:hypothetical protein
MTWNDVAIKLDQLLAEEKKHEPETPEWVDQAFAMAKLVIDRSEIRKSDPPSEVALDVVNSEIVFKWRQSANTVQIMPIIPTHRILRVGNSYAKWMEIV